MSTDSISLIGKIGVIPDAGSNPVLSPNYSQKKKL